MLILKPISSNRGAEAAYGTLTESSEVYQPNLLLPGIDVDSEYLRLQDFPSTSQTPVIIMAGGKLERINYAQTTSGSAHDVNRPFNPDGLRGMDVYIHR
jgi:hypothetical protein